jgi:hypothetical protein
MAIWLIPTTVIWISLVFAIVFTLRLGREAGTMLARNRRRSERLRLSIPVFVYGWAASNRPFTDITNTLSVNIHGGLVAVPATVLPGQTVLLSNMYTNEEKQCRVVRVGPERDGKREVGFEFLHPEGWFWWVDFNS